MAAVSAQVQFRLAWYARWLLIVCTFVMKYFAGIRIPAAWVTPITNRSWRMRVDDGPWVPVRIDNAGRIVS